MARKQLPNRLALLCDDCGTEIFVDNNMVMLEDNLWKSISEEPEEESYCDCCIEDRLGRKIKKNDLKLPSDGMGFEGMIPCNYWWAKQKRKDLT